MSSRVPPPRVNPKDLYTWASSELLDECSCLLSTRAIREHKGDSCSYNHRAFAKRHDDDIVVLPCTLGEPVCGDERANDGLPFFYFYQVVFKTIGVRLPFSRFEKELLTEINAAPAQLYPNSWAFVKAFDILFGFLGCAPSVDIFLHFFEVKRQRNNLWVTLSNVPGRVLFTLFQNSFTGWKGRFFKICCFDLVPFALDGFPLYWVRETRALKSKPFKKLALNDQVVCRILAEAGGFDSATLISLEFNAGTLEKYICMSHCPRNFRLCCFLSVCVLLHGVFDTFVSLGAGSKINQERRSRLTRALRTETGASSSSRADSSDH